MDLRDFERFQLSETEAFYFAQLLPVMDKVVALLRELYPEYLRPPKQEPRLSADLLHELAPLNRKKRAPRKAEPSLLTRKWFIANDRDRERRPAAKK
jgi:hypothetical protein